MLDLNQFIFIFIESGSVQIFRFGLFVHSTQKQDQFDVYVGFESVHNYFYRIEFSSGFQIQFICPAYSKASVINFQSDELNNLGCNG